MLLLRVSLRLAAGAPADDSRAFSSTAPFGSAATADEPTGITGEAAAEKGAAAAAGEANEFALDACSGDSGSTSAAGTAAAAASDAP